MNVALNKISHEQFCSGEQNRSKLLSGESFCLAFFLYWLGSLVFRHFFQKLDLEQIPRNGVDSFLFKQLFYKSQKTTAKYLAPSTTHQVL